MTRAHHYNLVYLHARRKPFPAFAEIVLAVQEIWPWGEVESCEEVESRLAGRWPTNLVEATVWKLVGGSLASGHLLVDLEQHTLDRTLPLALLPLMHPHSCLHPCLRRLKFLHLQIGQHQLCQN